MVVREIVVDPALASRLMPRLQKVLAARGVGSRRAAESMIAEGRISVNGVIAHPGQNVLDRDEIAVDGRPLGDGHPPVYLAVHKPTGVVTTLRATHGEPTVAELVSVPERVFPVGRLDKETSGLLLMTNDGDWANRVSHPRYEIEKAYDVLVRGVPDEDTLRRLRNGVQLPDGTVTAPARIELLRKEKDRALLSVTVIEGKKRQIRLMAVAAGHPVLSLRRMRVGSISLAGLPEGAWRYLEAEEVENFGARGTRTAQDGPPGWPADRNRRPGRRRQVHPGSRPCRSTPVSVSRHRLDV